MAERRELRAGPLTGAALRVSRSGWRWLRGDGDLFAPGDVLAFCNVVLTGGAPGLGDLYRYDVERMDLQVALVAAVPGRLHRQPAAGGGGWLDRQEVFAWDPDAAIAQVTPLRESDSDARLARPQFVAGRRASELGEDRSGLLTGWHDRSRAWRQGPAGAAGPTGTVLGLGACDLFSVLRGERGAFVEMLDHATGPAQVVDIPDRPLVHSARVIIEQIGRSAADRAALAGLFAGAIAGDPAGLSPQDWTFAAMCVAALSRVPTGERYDVLTPAGIETTGPADAVVLSAISEPAMRLRHSQLGFAFDCHAYRAQHLGPAMRQWFAREFELVANPVEDSRRDIIELARHLRAQRPGREILVLNTVSTLGSDEVINYAGFDAPLGQSLRGYRARELNAMLDDLARDGVIALVDADAIAADLGSGAHVPDGMHASGAMQAMLRDEIATILQVRGVPGFC